MKYRIPLLAQLAFLIIILGFTTTPDDSVVSDPESEIRVFLDEFLEGAAVNSYEIHDRFWAESLIYTSSAGLRFGKAEIMGGLNPDAGESIEPDLIYSADDVRIEVFGDTAILVFRLVATEIETGDVTTYLNSGTFRNLEGEWRVVLWQATQESE